MNDDRDVTDKSSDSEADAGMFSVMRLRGYLKLWAVTIAVTEVFSAIFSFAINALDADAAFLPVVIFTCATGALFSRWLIIDAHHAWLHARKLGCVTHIRGRQRPLFEVRLDCPKRWLVVLYAELRAGADIKA